MGKGQPWLVISCCSKAVFSSAPPAFLSLFLLVLILMLPRVTKSIPLSMAPSSVSQPPLLTLPPPQTQPPPPFLCPSVCQCYNVSNHTAQVPGTAAEANLVVACVHAGLTDLPANLPPSLKVLDLRGNHLRRLTDQLPSLSALTFLDVSNNSLKLLERGIFHNMTSLETLVLSFNTIEAVEDRVFENLTSLHTLDLAFNHIQSLTGYSLSGLGSVQVLNLTGNWMGTLSNQMFHNLQGLKVLDLSHNLLQHLPADAFWGLQSLQFILLNHNSIMDVTETFHSLFHLSDLDLSHNRLDVLENDTFTNLPHLSTLHLSFNNISYISPTFFTGKALGLRSLDLQGNDLEQLEPNLFESFPMLERLDVSQMPYLQSASLGAFEGVGGLRELNLSHNPRLSFLHPQLLSGLPSLAVLDLRANNLSKVSHITFQLNPRLQHLWLANNPWVCSCALAWMLGPPPYSQDTASTSPVVISDLDSVSCHLPDTTNNNSSSSSNNNNNTSAVPISQLSQETLRCKNVTSVNVTDVVYAKVGSHLVLWCDYVADETSVLTWTTPRGLIFHYYPFFHPHANAHLPTDIINDTDFHAGHSWHSEGSYNNDLQHSPDHVVLQKDGSLFIDSVLRSDAGPYQCSLHNAQHRARARTLVRLDYRILFEVKIMSIIVGLACAASFFALNTVYVVIMWGARKLVNKRRRERIHKIMENLDDYRTTQISRIRANYSYQLGRIRDHYHAQSIRLKDNYNTQMKRVRQGCSNQVDRIRDNYHARLNHLKDLSSHQIQQIRDGTNNQIIRIRDYGSLQMERLRETYKLQQQHMLKVIEAMNLENCRTVVETECMRTESMIFNITLPDLDRLEDDITSCEEEVASQPDSVYATALNSDRSSQESLATLVDGGGEGRDKDLHTRSISITVLPSDPPHHINADNLHGSGPGPHAQSNPLSVLSGHDAVHLQLQLGLHNAHNLNVDAGLLDEEADMLDVDLEIDAGLLNTSPPEDDGCEADRESVTYV